MKATQTGLLHSFCMERIGLNRQQSASVACLESRDKKQKNRVSTGLWFRKKRTSQCHEGLHKVTLC